MKKPIKSSYVREKAGQGTDISVCALSGCCFHEQLALRANFRNYSMGVSKCQWIFVQQKISKEVVRTPQLGQHRTIPALRLKHRSGSCGTASALPKCSIMSGCGTRIVHRGQKPLALCDRCPCFGSLHPPLAALTFAASSIICAFGLASAAPRSPYRHLELCGIALELFKFVLGIVRDRYNIVLELFQVTSHFFAFQASLSFSLSFYRAAAVICRYRSQQHRQSAFPA